MWPAWLARACVQHGRWAGCRDTRSDLQEREPSRVSCSAAARAPGRRGSPRVVHTDTRHPTTEAPSQRILLSINKTHMRMRALTSPVLSGASPS